MPEKPFVKLLPAYSVTLALWYVVNGWKIKITVKFCASSCRFEDTKGSISPEMRPKSFGTFEKRVPEPVIPFLDVNVSIINGKIITDLHTKRGYKRHFLQQGITPAKNTTRNEALSPKSPTTITTDKSECVPFILTNNRALRSISSIFCQTWAFHPIVATAYSSLHLLLLSDAATRQPSLNNTPLWGFFQCGSNFSTCTYISNGLTS